jgi:hypothetical protein
MPNCPKCGAEVKEGFKFCLGCGAQIQTGTSQVPPVTKPAPQTQQTTPPPAQQPSQQMYAAVPPKKSNTKLIIGVVAAIIAIVVVVIVVVLFIGGGTVGDSALVGTWSYEDPTMGSFAYTFNSDNSVDITMGEATMEVGTWSTNGDQLCVSFMEMGEQCSTYSISGNQLTWSYMGDTLTLTKTS